MKQPPYSSPSEAIWYIKNNYLTDGHDDFRGLSWREVAESVSMYMDGKTSKAVMWNVAHKKYKCPSDVCKALRKMGILKSMKRWRFFYEVDSREEYEQFKREYLCGDTFKEWVESAKLREDWENWE